MAATLHYSLLEQAFHLARRAKKRPNQADLRRSVSVSYYVLFHLLIDEATKRICRVKDHAPLRHHLARTFQHSNMRKAAEQFSRSEAPKFLTPVFGTDTLDERLVFVKILRSTSLLNLPTYQRIRSNPGRKYVKPYRLILFFLAYIIRKISLDNSLKSI